MTFSKIRIYFKVQSRKIEKRGEKVFPNLEAEMARNKVTQVKLAEILGITPTTLSFKMNGKSTLSLKECVEIKRKAFPDKTLDYLFATDETGSEEGREERTTVNINVICFLIVTFIAIICGAIEYKMKLPDWKLLIAWTILMEVLAVLLLISRLMT